MNEIGVAPVDSTGVAKPQEVGHSTPNSIRTLKPLADCVGPGSGATGATHLVFSAIYKDARSFSTNRM